MFFSAETLVLQLGYALLAVAAVMARGGPRLFIALAAALLLLDALLWSHSTVTEVWMGLVLLACLLVVLRDLVAARAVRFSAEEEAMFSGFLAGVPRHVARHLIDSGVWLNGTVGDELTLEGKPVERVAFLASGEALVLSDGRQVATCRAGDLIGEASVLTGEAATATVMLAGPARFWCMPADALRAHLESDVELRTLIERSFARAVRSKLHASNRTIAAAGGVA
jgi:CRP-like cAMP-binding protein